MTDRTEIRSDIFTLQSFISWHCERDSFILFIVVFFYYGSHNLVLKSNINIQAESYQGKPSWWIDEYVTEMCFSEIAWMESLLHGVFTWPIQFQAMDLPIASRFLNRKNPTNISIFSFFSRLRECFFLFYKNGMFHPCSVSIFPRWSFARRSLKAL